MDQLNRFKNNVLNVFSKSKSAKLKQEAQKLEKNRQYLEAIDIYLEVLDLEPSNKEIYFRLGGFYEGFEKNSQALEMYKSSLSLDIHYREPVDRIRDLILNKPDLEISADFFEELLLKVATLRQRKILLSLLGHLHEKEKKYHKAIEQWERALKIFSRNSEALKALARLYALVDHKNKEKHKKVLEQLFRKTPDDEEICTALAKIYHNEKIKTKEAVTVYLKALEFRQDWKENILILSEVSSRGIKNETLKEIYEKAVEYSEEKGFVTFQLARIKEKLKDYNGAEEAYKNSIDYYEEIKELNPQYHLGKLYLKLGKHDEAEKVFKNMLEKDSKDMEPLIELKKLLSKSARKKSLTVSDLHILKSAYDLKPDCKSYNYLAEEYMKLYEPDEAIKAYKSSMEVKPQKDVLKKLIKLYRELKYWNELVSALKTSIGYTKNREEKIKIYLMKIEIYIQKLEDEGKAIEKLEAILKLDQTNIDAHKKLYYLNSINQDFNSISENFMALIESKPLDPEVYNFIANVLTNLKNPLQTFYATQIVLIMNSKHTEAMDRLLNLNKEYLDVFNKRKPVISEKRFEEFLICKWETDFNRLFYWLKPVLEQFYSHTIDNDILLNSTDITEKTQDPFYYEISTIISSCSKIILSDIPKVFLYRGKEVFTIILNKDKEDKPFMIINYDFINKASSNEKYFILGQHICYLKRDNIVYKHLSKNLPVLLAEFIVATLVSRIPIPIPKSLSNKCKNIPIDQFVGQLKNATLPSYFQDWAKTILKDKNRSNIIENMIQGIDQTADQCGFLCCGNVNTAVTTLVRQQTDVWDKPLKPGDIIRVMKKDQSVKKRIINLCKFALNRTFLDIFKVKKNGLEVPMKGEPEEIETKK